MKLDKVEQEQRAFDIEKGEKEPFWDKWLRPYIEGRIEYYKNIRHIDAKNIDTSYIKNLMRVDVYKNIIDKIEEWKKGGDKDA